MISYDCLYPVTRIFYFHFAEKEEVSKPTERKTLRSMFEKSEPVSFETIYMRRLFDFLYRGFEHTLYNQV